MARLPAPLLLLAPLLAACSSAPSQLPAVEGLMARSRLLRIACLDANNDGRVDVSDAQAGTVPDITGDAVFDEADLEVLRTTNLVLSQAKPAGCDGQPAPDWQVSAPAAVDCRDDNRALVILGVGGGAVELSNPSAAAGVRWMLAEIGADLAKLGIRHQLVSVAPGLNGTEHPQPDAETWAATYLATELVRLPCLRAVLLGHSHGGALVSAVAAFLEAAGLGDRILLTVLVDRVTALYAGDSSSLPHAVPVLNIYQTNDALLRGAPLDRPNVDNWDASGRKGPANGERGGRATDMNHTNIDNSRAVIDQIARRVVGVSRNGVEVIRP